MEITARIMGDVRIAGMRSRLGRAVEGVTRIWSLDVEVVQVGTFCLFVFFFFSSLAPYCVFLLKFNFFFGSCSLGFVRLHQTQYLRCDSLRFSTRHIFSLLPLDISYPSFPLPRLVVNRDLFTS